MIFAIVYKSHNHWSVHIPLVLSYTSFPIQPNLHAYSAHENIHFEVWPAKEAVDSSWCG